MTLTKANYQSYITSSEWRSKHKEFLAKSHYRCAFSGLRIGKKRRYNIHHCNYQNLGNEKLCRDVVALHPWIHKWIIHGVLSGFKRPSKQQRYPNKAQQIAHFWCCQPWLLRVAVVGLTLVNLVRFL